VSNPSAVETSSSHPPDNLVVDLEVVGGGTVADKVVAAETAVALTS